ncbi:MAG: hypothetical protein BGN87_06405 [Rhizobiales bacterium 65-79]|jgi:hypothetical protein|nr:hypothetical protein [Hyphomicrobiales bacterium]OJU02821.1 MAG: hypothetical protein BGN87_06405 [Rhizobiales bacterium 65-79]
MSTIWIEPEHARIRSYTSSSKGARAIVKVEIEVDDPDALGWLLREIAKAQLEGPRRRAEAAEQSRAEKKRQTNGRKAIRREKLLGLPDYTGGRS